MTNTNTLQLKISSFKKLLAVALLVSAATIFSLARVNAARNIQTVEIKKSSGTTYTNVTASDNHIATNPGETVDVKITTEVTNPSNWRSTGVRIATGPGSADSKFFCFTGTNGHPDFPTDGAPYEVAFTIPKDHIPPAEGTRNLYVKLFSDTSCTANGGWSNSEKITYTGVIQQGPIAYNDTLNTTKNIAVSGNVLNNDYTDASINDDPVTAMLVDDVDPAKGTLDLASNGEFTYTPANGFLGTTTFTYKVLFMGEDSEGFVEREGNTATATIKVSLISPDVENAGPNNGDANNDGTPDTDQPNIASFVNPTTDHYSVLVAPDACTVTSASIDTEPASEDGDYTYPAGLMDFTLNCGDPGFVADITQYHYGVEGDFVLRKYNPNTETYTTIANASIAQQTIGGQAATVATYQVKDGGELDIDGEENGIIIDPAGLATASTTNGLASTGRSAFVPLVFAAGLILLSLTGYVVLKKYRQTAS